MNTMRSKFQTAGIVLLMLVPALLIAQNGTKGQLAVSKEAMATTAHPLATEAALEMLHKGGNAIDAAVAAAFAIGVVEPDGSGLGGGGGMVVYLAKEQRSVYINYYQQASEEVNEVGFDPRTDGRTAKAVCVPGTVAGLTTALAKYGTLPLATVLAPAIRYAEGFPLDETLSKILLDNVDLVSKSPTLSALYLRDGFPLTQGDTLRQPDLGHTLRTIAAEGRNGFYDGPVAQALVDSVVNNGGRLTLGDLHNYNARVVEPLHGSYRGYEILAANAPQSGACIIEALNILENENLRKLGHFQNSTESLHLIAEALRRVYADRTAFLEDPAFGDVPLNGLTSKRYARARFEDINRAMADPRDYRKTQAGNPMSYDEKGTTQKLQNGDGNGTKEFLWDDEDEEGSTPGSTGSDDPFNKWGSKRKKQSQYKPDRSAIKDSSKMRIEDDSKEIESQLLDVLQTRGFAAMRQADDIPGEGGHTTHLSVVDKDGNAVSLTQTLGSFFGCGLVSAGVLLNQSMMNFSTTLSLNLPEPNKQPRSSISPTIVLKDGKPVLVVGSPGAGRIIATVVELIINVVDYGMGADEANNAPRFLCQKNDDFLSLESRISKDVQAGLEKKGHRIKEFGEFDLFFGGAQIILIDPATHTYYGSADPRRGGVAIGD